MNNTAENSDLTAGLSPSQYNTTRKTFPETKQNSIKVYAHYRVAQIAPDVLIFAASHIGTTFT